MVSVTVKSRINSDGILELKVPTDLPEGEVQVVLVIQSLNEEQTKGWPPNFFENTAGAWKGELERPAQGMFEERDLFHHEVSS